MAKKRVKKVNPGDMAKQVQRSTKRHIQRTRAAERAAIVKPHGVSLKSSFSKLQDVYFDNPEKIEKQNTLFSKRLAAASTGYGSANNTFSQGLLGKYQVKMLMRYYQPLWDRPGVTPEDRLNAILEGTGYSTFQEAWDEFATNEGNLEAMAVAQVLAENNGVVPDSAEEWVADLLSGYDERYIESLFLDLIELRY